MYNTMAKGEKHNNVSSGLQNTRIIKQHIFSFIGGGKRNTRRKPPTCRKSLTNFYHIILYRVHLAMIGIRTQNFSGDRH